LFGKPVRLAAFGGFISSAAQHNDWSFNGSRMIATSHELHIIYMNLTGNTPFLRLQFPVKSNGISRADSLPIWGLARVHSKGA
jgi:hypothetical protein